MKSLLTFKLKGVHIGVKIMTWVLFQLAPTKVDEK